MSISDAHRFLVFLIGLSAVLTVDFAVLADDTSCYLEASMEDTHVTVYEKVAWGPATEVIWDGLLKKYEKKLIRSKSGKIGYDYRLGSDDLTNADNSAECRGGNTISIP